MLCDSKLPVLLTYAKERGIPLRVWGPRPASIGLQTELLFSFNALVASWAPVSGGYEMSIEEYLETGVAVTPLGEDESRAYSPSQIIKWVANKEGASHFSFDKPATLEILKHSVWSSGETAVDAFQGQTCDFGVAEWTRVALAHCLGFENNFDPPAGGAVARDAETGEGTPAGAPPAPWRRLSSGAIQWVGRLLIDLGGSLVERGNRVK